MFNIEVVFTFVDWSEGVNEILMQQYVEIYEYFNNTHIKSLCYYINFKRALLHCNASVSYKKTSLWMRDVWA
jgi:hypothetical protein